MSADGTGPTITKSRQENKSYDISPWNSLLEEAMVDFQRNGKKVDIPFDQKKKIKKN